RRGHRRSTPGAYGVSRGEGRAITVAPRVDVDPAFAIHLAELLRELVGCELHRQRADRVGEARHLIHVRLAVEWHDQVEALRPGCLDPAGQAELLQHSAQTERPRACPRRIVLWRTEIEDADARGEEL